MAFELYQYQATVIDVHDGDTVTLLVDFGQSITKKDKYRLYGPDPVGKTGLNAPEINTDAGKVSCQALVEIINSFESKVFVQTVKDRKEKYGRYLAVIFGVSNDGILVNINQKMVDEGHAFLRKY